MDRFFLVCGSLSALISVAAGAFGAHGLRDKLGPEMLNVFEIGVRYQMYHALGLLAVGILLQRGFPVASAGWSFLVGTLVFSGSLYILSLSGVRWLGAITPLGGIAFLAGWALLAWGIFSRQG